MAMPTALLLTCIVCIHCAHASRISIKAIDQDMVQDESIHRSLPTYNTLVALAQANSGKHPQFV
jgi:hypothetical protein